MFERNGEERRIRVYSIATSLLVKASELMNIKDEDFESRILEIITDRRASIVIVLTFGESSFRLNEWEKELHLNKIPYWVGI